MSTIVIVKKGNEIAIAADTLTTCGGTKLGAGFKARKEKMLHCQGSHLGFVGYSVHQNVFESLMEKHGVELNFQGSRQIFESFLKLHPILKEKYFVNPKEDGEGPYESSQMDIVIANPHGIWAVSSYRNVTEFETFWAIGSGRDYALGAMYHAYDDLPTARDVAIAGVVAACEFDTSSGLPYTVHTCPMVTAPLPLPMPEALPANKAAMRFS